VQPESKQASWLRGEQRAAKQLRAASQSASQLYLHWLLLPAWLGWLCSSPSDLQLVGSATVPLGPWAAGVGPTTAGLAACSAGSAPPPSFSSFISPSALPAHSSCARCRSSAASDGASPWGA